jgi:CheY-like chemotaxis protein
MPIKILLADKSITIQKVVEMLFSGKEYEVQCVSDGETALSEASRVVPDVVLADIDLPRIDGYSFSARMKQTPALAQTPVILMMSRDDVFDEAKARQVSISDHIAKPFESQELISKVKKAVTAAPAPAAPRTPAAKPQATPSPAPPRANPKQAPPTDIFGIIEEAPGQADLEQAPASGAEDEGVYEVEPVVEVEEEQLPRDLEKALPLGEKAVEEMRKGLGIPGKGGRTDEDIVSFESLDMATNAAKEYMPPKIEKAAPVAREWKPPLSPAEPAPSPSQQQVVSESDLWNIAEATVSKMAKEMLAKMPPPQPPQVSEETLRRAVEEAVKESVSGIVRETARDIIEKVAWEVVPDLAATLIKAEIARLKAET